MQNPARQAIAEADRLASGSFLGNLQREITVVDILTTELEDVLCGIFQPEFPVVYQTGSLTGRNCSYVELVIRHSMPMRAIESGKLTYLSVSTEDVEVWDGRIFTYPLSSPTLFEDVLNRVCKAAETSIHREVSHLRAVGATMVLESWLLIEDRVRQRKDKCLREAFSRI